MYVSSLSIERFGAWSNLHLDRISDGLSVVFGHPGSGKSAMVQFLRAMFGGFDSDIRQHYLIHSSRGCGGSVTMQSGQGRQTISRYDDGGREGRLTVQRPDGAIIGRRHLHDLLGDFPLGLLDKVYFVDFDRRPDVSELLAEVISCGLADAGSEIGNGQRSRIEHKLAVGEQKVARLRRRIAKIERSLAQLDRAQRNLPGAADHGVAAGTRSDRLAEKLRSVETRLQLWKRTLRDIAERGQRKSAESALRAVFDLHTEKPHSRSRRVLRSLEKRVQGIQRAIERMAPQTGGACQCASLHHTVTEPMRELSRGIYEVCNALNDWQENERQRQKTVDREQFARCAKELRKSIRWLQRRRMQILARLNPPQTTHVLHPDHARLCQCAAHPESVRGGHQVSSPDAETFSRRRNSIAERIRSLAQERFRRLGQLSAWESKVVQLRARVSRRGDAMTTLAATASGYLQSLSVNRWRHLHVAPQHPVMVEDQDGHQVAYQDLDPGARDQVYLALCLAIVALGDRRGWQLPLVINAAFTDYPSRHIGDALDVLRSLGARRQVLCLTRHEHVASVARQLNTPVHELRARASEVEHGMLAAEAVPPEGNGEHRSSHSLNAPEYSLCEEHPIECAPSIDEMNATRLRQVGVSRVGDLIRVVPSEVAAKLTSSGVTEEMIETWRAQARLMCRVRGLRPYDARILVACGIRDPEHLVDLQSGALRARVKEFAASSQGQALLLSGTEYELSRITDWIDAARAGLQSAGDAPASSTEPLAGRGASPGAAETLALGPPSPERRRRRSPQSDKSRRSRTHRRWQDQRSAHASQDETVNADAETYPLVDSSTGHRFYLQRTDPIAAAPSIGPAVARRLLAIGVQTVADLLDANPETIANRLKHRRIDRATARRWQVQSELVCRVPWLRGHDAQFLVASGVTSVEQLAGSTPIDLLRSVQKVLQTLEGKRVLRGAKEPDLAEVTRWIEAARQARTLLAA